MNLWDILKEAMMSRVSEITRESWILDTFPTWGTWLNEEIEEEEVKPGTFAMWWLGCTGLWIKTENSTNICIDLWVKSGKRTKKNKLMKKQHQHQRAVGCVALQPNLRNSPVVIDPFAIKNLDVYLVTHEHSDHHDVYTAAAILQNTDESVKFVGPKVCHDIWLEWGVPEERIVIVKPGDEIKVKDTTIKALESFDRTCMVTAPQGVTLKGNPLMNMDEKAVNYLIETPAGNIYNAADSHYSNMYAKHGKEHKVDVAMANYGENPIGMTDKLTAEGVLRMAECLKCSTVIPYHHDAWTNFMINPYELLAIWNMKKTRLKYKFKPYIWQVGGKFIWPENKDDLEFMFDRGFHDVYTIETDMPYYWML